MDTQHGGAVGGAGRWDELREDRAVRRFGRCDHCRQEGRHAVSEETARHQLEATPKLVARRRKIDAPATIELKLYVTRSEDAPAAIDCLIRLRTLPEERLWVGNHAIAHPQVGVLDKLRVLEEATVDKPHRAGRFGGDGGVGGGGRRSVRCGTPEEFVHGEAARRAGKPRSQPHVAGTIGTQSAIFMRCTPVPPSGNISLAELARPRRARSPSPPSSLALAELARASQ